MWHIWGKTSGDDVNSWWDVGEEPVSRFLRVQKASSFCNIVAYSVHFFLYLNTVIFSEQLPLD